MRGTIDNLFDGIFLVDNPGVDESLPHKVILGEVVVALLVSRNTAALLMVMGNSRVVNMGGSDRNRRTGVSGNSLTENIHILRGLRASLKFLIKFIRTEGELEKKCFIFKKFYFEKILFKNI